VGQVTQEFEKSERMSLVMAPEGTRKAAPYWKSGFVKIAADANVPIVPVYLHFPRKEVVVGSPIHFDRDEKVLMDEFRIFFAAGEGKGGQGKGPVRLKDERSI
jgi:1-acyl-sn-glycerol-3-phosphate acyltransferase